MKMNRNATEQLRGCEAESAALATEIKTNQKKKEERKVTSQR